MSENSVYIGDGVYLSNDGYQLWLAANHHENKTIALEPAVFENFVAEGTKMLSTMYGK